MEKLTIPKLMEQFKVQPTECLTLVFRKKYATVDRYGNLLLQLPKCQIIKEPYEPLLLKLDFKPDLKKRKYLPITDDAKEINFFDCLQDNQYLSSFLTIYNTAKGKPHHIDFEALLNKTDKIVLVISFGRFFKNRRWINAAYYTYHYNKEDKNAELERFASDFD